MPYAITGTLSDRSGSITAGGTSQQVAAANEGRFYLLIQNISSGDLWVNLGVAAVQDSPSLKLLAGSSVEFSSSGTGYVPEDAIHIIGATTGQKFVAKEVIG